MNVLVVTPYTTGKPRPPVWTYGDVEDHEVEDGNLQRELYRLINCHAVEAVSLSPDITMWVDEEGLLKVHPVVNYPATLIARHFGFASQMYVGVAVFTGGATKEGESVGLDPAMAAFLRKVLDPSAP